MTFHYTALITVLCVLLQFCIGANVGRARGKFKIAAPATTGHPEFERVMRVQMNTVESTLMFLPVLWVFAFYFNDCCAAALGAAWLVGRVLYAIGYQRDASKRSVGFLIGIVAIAVLMLGDFFGVIRALLH